MTVFVYLLHQNMYFFVQIDLMLSHKCSQSLLIRFAVYCSDLTDFFLQKKVRFSDEIQS